MQLKDFRRKREVKTSNAKHPDISEKASPSNNNVNLSDVGYEEKSTHDLSSSTAVNTESILQVSSTLTGLIAEVERLTENGTSNGNIHEILEENSSKSNLTHVGDTIKDLQKRNVELSERLGTIEVEREQLFAQCQNLSDQLQISSGYLSKIIKEKEDKNFFEYINHFRVEAVKSMLKDEKFSNYTIMAIAMECGFKSKSTFNSVFKKITRQTPSAFKRMHPAY